MTPWQKFKREVNNIRKEYWFLFVAWPIWMYEEFRAKCKPPFIIKFPLFWLSLILMVLLIVPNIIFGVGVGIYACLYGMIDFRNAFGIKRWLTEINREAP